MKGNGDICPPPIVSSFQNFQSFQVFKVFKFLKFKVFCLRYIRKSAPLFNNIIIFGIMMCLSTVVFFGFPVDLGDTETFLLMCKVKQSDFPNSYQKFSKFGVLRLPVNLEPKILREFHSFERGDSVLVSLWRLAQCLSKLGECIRYSRTESLNIR